MSTTVTPGQRLPNGAIALLYANDTVLAARPLGDTVEYVTWNVNPYDGNTVNGHYFFLNLAAALDDFHTRSGTSPWED